MAHAHHELLKKGIHLSSWTSSWSPGLSAGVLDLFTPSALVSIPASTFVVYLSSFGMYVAPNISLVFYNLATNMWNIQFSLIPVLSL
jgi:hypothetical protein